MTDVVSGCCWTTYMPIVISPSAQLSCPSEEQSVYNCKWGKKLDPEAAGHLSNRRVRPMIHTRDHGVNILLLANLPLKLLQSPTHLILSNLSPNLWFNYFAPIGRSASCCWTWEARVINFPYEGITGPPPIINGDHHDAWIQILRLWEHPPCRSLRVMPHHWCP